jgi:Rad3-related DNA helicase
MNHAVSHMEDTFTPPGTQTDAPPALPCWHFAHPPRPEQTAAIDILLGVKPGETAALQMPTGLGKSPVLSSLALDHGGVILTPYKMLQDQYMRDWPHELADFRGRENYHCQFAPSNLPPNCKSGKHLRCNTCPYRFAKKEFLTSRAGLTNYANYLVLNPSSDHSWILFDESHQLPDLLMGAFSITWSKRLSEILTEGEPFFPKTEPGIGNYRTITEECLSEMRDGAMKVLDELKTRLEDNVGQSAKNNFELASRADMLSHFVNILTIATHLTQEGSPYVYDEGIAMSWSAKPVMCDGLYRIWGASIGISKRKVALVSATILSEELLGRWIGQHVKYTEFSSPFPLKRRPVYYRGSGCLSYKRMDEEFPKALKDMDSILTKYPGYKGVVHCQSFKLGKRIYEASRHQDRFLVHRFGEPLADLIEIHKSSTAPSIILSPAASEGVDLANDLGRLNIIFKVPFPSLDSNWVKAKMNLDEGWYEWTTVKTIIQQCGRTTRHNKDWSMTFILDANFERVYNSNRHLFPTWFCDSIC